MSTRQLRKLQQQRELEQAQAKLEAEVEEEEESEDEIPTKSKPSLFANLAALEDEGDNEDDAEEDEPAELSEPEPTPQPTTKKPKKSKKKKKGKGKGKENAAESKELQKPENGVDEIDAAIRELNLKKSAWAKADEAFPVDPEYEKVCTLLGAHTQHLKVANEMRALFGRAATEVHDDPGGPVGRGARQRQRGQNQPVDLETALKGHHLPGKGLPELTLRRNNFIQGKADWPKAPTGGLIMEVIDDPGEEGDGVVEFAYAHNKQYQILQQTFHGFVEMGDPQNLIGLLIRNPYHISLLLQVSKIAKDQGDHALSSDLIERALFTFGRASLTQFNNKVSKGKARLDFFRPENREVWLAGYHYIKSLIMKGTYRTALEWAKFLLSLDPEVDPYCMRFMIHHLALRAQEFKWLTELWESDILSLWETLDGNGDRYPNPAIQHFMPSLAFAAMQLRDGAKCRKILTESMQKVPWLFGRLFKELNLDVPPSIWGVEPRNDAETLFTEMYVLQTKDLWGSPEGTTVLMEVAHTIPKVDISTVPRVDNSEMTLDVVRFVYLDNTPALMALAPSQLLHKSNNSDSDPIPPNTNIYSYESQRQVLEGREDARRGMGGDFMDPLAAIARLLPDLGRGGGGGAGGEQQAEARLRADIEEAMANEGLEGDEEVGAEAGGGERISTSLARRLMNMFWPGARDDGDEGEWEEEDDEDVDTETDDEMPELVEPDQ